MRVMLRDYRSRNIDHDFSACTFVSHRLMGFSQWNSDMANAARHAVDLAALNNAGALTRDCRIQAGSKPLQRVLQLNDMKEVYSHVFTVRLAWQSYGD